MNGKLWIDRVWGSLQRILTPREPATGRQSALGSVLLLAACLTVWRVLPYASGTIAAWSSPPTWAGPTPELDTYLIHRGLVKAPRFTDTLQWWTGVWVQQLPFYRPLSSSVFWCEWKAFGDREKAYDLLAAGVHVVATLLFTALVYRLAQQYGVTWPAWAAIAGTCGFIGLLSPYRLGIVSRILWWKNQPDSLAAACCFAALLAYLRAQGGTRGALAAAGAWYLAGCGFKEIAVPLPVVCLALEPAMPRAGGERKSRLRPGALERVLLMGTLAVLFLAVRWAAIGGVGYTYGSNWAWLGRTLIHLAGPFAPTVTQGEWLGNALGVWIFLAGVVLVWQRRRGPITAAPSGRGRAWLAAAVVLLFFLGWVGMGWLDLSMLEGREGGHGDLSLEAFLAGFLMSFQPVPLATAVSTVAFLVAMAATYRWCRPLLWVGLLWTVAFLAPLTFSSGPNHRYYLPQAGYLLIYAAAVGVGLPLLARMMGRSAAPAH